MKKLCEHCGQAFDVTGLPEYTIATKRYCGVLCRENAGKARWRASGRHKHRIALNELVLGSLRDLAEEYDDTPCNIAKRCIRFVSHLIQKKRLDKDLFMRIKVEE